MARGKTTTRTSSALRGSGRALSGATTHASDATLVGSAASTSPAADEIAAVRADVKREVIAAALAQLDEFDKGNGRSPISYHREADDPAHEPPVGLLEAAHISSYAGDMPRAERYLAAAFAHNRKHIAWLMSQSAGFPAATAPGLKLAAAEWTSTRISELMSDRAALAAASEDPRLGEAFRIDGRLERDYRRALTAAAVENRDDVAHALAVEMARVGAGAESFAEEVAKFDPERVLTVGRVARALAYDPTIIDGARDGIDMVILKDIAGTGRRWREARLEALYGREYEMEYLRLRHWHMPRRYREGIPSVGGDGREFDSAQGALIASRHRVRVAKDAGLGAHDAVAVSTWEAMYGTIARLGRLPGRVRCRSLRVGRGARRGSTTLAYEVLYEGLNADDGEPVSLAFRLLMDGSRQVKPENQLARIRASLPDMAPPVEDGLWECAHAEDTRVEAVLPAPSLADPPRASLDLLLGGSPAPCNHRTLGWVSSGPMASVMCANCGDTLLKRPTARISKFTVGTLIDPEKAAEVHLPRLQALAALVGSEPPKTGAALLDMPRCDDWRAEIRREQREAREADRSRTRGPQSVREAMMRR